MVIKYWHHLYSWHASNGKKDINCYL